MNQQPTPSPDEQEYPYWRRVYITVIIYTTALIIGLWAFSKLFE